MGRPIFGVFRVFFESDGVAPILQFRAAKSIEWGNDRSLNSAERTKHAANTVAIISYNNNQQQPLSTCVAGI